MILVYGICAIIPPTIGRPTEKPPTTRFRRLMKFYLRRPQKRRCYGQRWQVKTVVNMLRRRLGETLNARNHHRQNRALLLKVIAHNLMIVWWIGFFTKQVTPGY